MIRKFLLMLAVLAASLAFVPAAEACPMCKLANEQGANAEQTAVANARPRAYMYSILFMLSMPATLTAAFGLAFYRMHKRQQALQQASESAADVLPDATPA